MNLMHKWYMAPDEPVGGPAAPPPVETEAPETQQTQETPTTGPWDESLARAFPDEAMRGQVDQYLRSEIQPYITRKEQELGAVADVWTQLWDDNESFPTYLELANTLYGEDVAIELAQTLAKHYEQQGLEPEAAAQAAVETVDAQAQQQAQQQGPPNLEDWLQTVPPEFQQYVTEQFETREDETYSAQLDAIAKTEPTLNAKTDVFDGRAAFSRYVSSTEGDLPAALALWQREMVPTIKAAPEVFGYKDPATAATTATQETTARTEAPVVLGSSSTVGATTPPQKAERQSMDEAIHDFMVDLGHAG